MGARPPAAARTRHTLPPPMNMRARAVRCAPQQRALRAWLTSGLGRGSTPDLPHPSSCRLDLQLPATAPPWAPPRSHPRHLGGAAPTSGAARRCSASAPCAERWTAARRTRWVWPGPLTGARGSVPRGASRVRRVTAPRPLPAVSAQGLLLVCAGHLFCGAHLHLCDPEPNADGIVAVKGPLPAHPPPPCTATPLL